MNATTRSKINEVFLEVEGEYEDKSTEFILEITAQRCVERKIKRDCDAGDVAEAIEE